MKSVFRLVVACLLVGFKAAAADSIHWQSWSPAIFEQARRQHRFVLLDLQAVWCHWCHVMDAESYANPEVIALINSNYIAVRVDQDANPELSNRYEDYGWPATVVFNADKGEIVKRQGYLPPGEMIAMLKAIIADPTPGPSVRPARTIHFQKGVGLTPELRAKLEQKLIAGFDQKMGAWGFDQKFLNCDNVEYCMSRGNDDGGRYEKMARKTLDEALQLVDPAWGGVYQYSTDDDWKHPHFEKIMSMQAGQMRIYALAYARYGDRKYLRAAEAISRYLKNFLTSPDGLFYTSQDADLIDGQHSADYFKLDDANRRRRGIPRIDQHIYPRENGWAGEALSTLYGVTGDTNDLDRAIRATRCDWVTDFGCYTHGSDGVYLGDTLAMGRAFLSLYEVTANRSWLQEADRLSWPLAWFRGQPGYQTEMHNNQSTFPPTTDYGENVAMTRFANLLYHYTGNKTFQDAAQNAMDWLASPDISGKRFADVGGVLLADEEMNSEPIHLTIVGSKRDPVAQSLWQVATTVPTAYRRLEWYDPAESPLPNADVQYPALETPAAFVCTGNACSRPMTAPEQLEKRLRSLVK